MFKTFFGRIIVFHIYATCISLSCISPSTNLVPFINLGISLYRFILCYFFYASRASLNTIVRVANLVPHPFVFSVLNLTVANVDSITLVDLIWIQCSQGKSFILCQTFTCIFKLCMIQRYKVIICNKCLLPCRSHIDIMNLVFAFDWTLFGILSRMLAVLCT